MPQAEAGALQQFVQALRGEIPEVVQGGVVPPGSRLQAPAALPALQARAQAGQVGHADIEQAVGFKQLPRSLQLRQRVLRMLERMVEANGAEALAPEVDFFQPARPQARPALPRAFAQLDVGAGDGPAALGREAQKSAGAAADLEQRAAPPQEPLHPVELALIAGALFRGYLGRRVGQVAVLPRVDDFRQALEGRPRALELQPAARAAGQVEALRVGGEAFRLQVAERAANRFALAQLGFHFRARAAEERGRRFAGGGHSGWGEW